MAIIKYEGNEKYFIGLLKDEDNKLFVIYALTDGLNLNCEEEDFTIDFNYSATSNEFLKERHYSLNIPIIPKNNRDFTMICITDENQYDLIKMVVESLL